MSTIPDLRWLTPPLTSALHATWAVMTGRTLVEARVAEAIAEPVEGLAREIVAARLPAEKFWNHLLPLSPGSGSPRQLAETALIKTLGRSPTLEALAGRIGRELAALDAAFRRLFPQLGEELQLRGGPLREQWEARGPGLMFNIFRLTDENFAVASADVLLVQPMLGGAGKAHLLYNSVRIEAVLANPTPELPEVVRLGWLLAQLNLEIPTLNEHVNTDRLPHVAELALLPAALQAGQEVELCRYDRANIALAVNAWNVNMREKLDLADSLGQWWETYLDTRPAWPVALAALERMVGNSAA